MSDSENIKVFERKYCQYKIKPRVKYTVSFYTMVEMNQMEGLQCYKSKCGQTLLDHSAILAKSVWRTLLKRLIILSK